MNLSPEGSVKKVLKIAVAVVLICMIFEMFSSFDFDVYAKQLALNKEKAAELNLAAEDINIRLNRIAVEQECEEYLIEAAKQREINLSSAEISVRWNIGGYWVPSAAKLKGEYSKELSELIVAELGISSSQQVWTDD